MRHQSQSFIILVAEVTASQALYLVKQQGCHRVVRFSIEQEKGNRQNDP
jgi:hypothetical protein